jgi:anaerobic magnesium-protoporphyrin IX monomethyl ester cyclase
VKILFVVYRLDYADQIAIACLSSIAKQLGHSTYFCSVDSENLTDKVKEIRPHIVGYSANILAYKPLVEANSEAKKSHNYISIMGGPHPTFSPETFSESGMDVYCIGEGELPFRDFLIKIEQGESYDDIANLITKNKANTVCPLIKNLDELPEADRDLVISNSFLKNTPKKTFYATRGCPFNC